MHHKYFCVNSCAITQTLNNEIQDDVNTCALEALLAGRNLLEGEAMRPRLLLQVHQHVLFKLMLPAKTQILYCIAFDDDNTS